MITDDFDGFSNVVETVTERGLDGSWKVTYTVTHKKKKKGGWDERHVTITAYDEEIGKALASAVMSVDTYLSKYNHDLFEVDLDNPSERLEG